MTIYMKFKHEPDKSMVIEVRKVVASGIGVLTKEGPSGAFQDTRNAGILNWVKM